MQIWDQTCRPGSKRGVSLCVHGGNTRPSKGSTAETAQEHLPAHPALTAPPGEGQNTAQAPWWCEHFRKKYTEMKHRFRVLWGRVRGRNPSANLRIHFSSILQKATQTVLYQHYKTCCLGQGFKSHSHHTVDPGCVTHVLRVCWSNKVTGFKTTQILSGRHLDWDQLHNLHHSKKRMSLPLQGAVGRREQWLGKRVLGIL